MADHDTVSAYEFLASVVDPGSFTTWDAPVPLPDDPSYAATLRRARERAGVDEAVVTGRARVDGHDIAVVAGEFGFLGGSVGRAAADRIVAAVRRATARRLPLLVAPASGGTRMQEGTPAFVAMVDLTKTVVEHKAAGLPFLAYLRHPTTGGVLASWGSLGHLTYAEPGALVGFLGPSVYEALHGLPFPAGIQQSENLHRRGVVDAVVTTGELRALLARVLRLLSGSVEPSMGQRSATHTSGASDAWASIRISSRQDRPGARELLESSATDVVRLSGTGAGERGDRILGCLAAFDGLPCVVVAQDRLAQRELGPLGPGDLRAARRMVRLAGDLRLPLVTVIDTPGAELSVAAEEGALAGEIARLLAELAAVRVPSVSVLLGEGCGGAALAMLPAQRVVAAEHAWLSPLPLAGASTLLYGTPERAAEAARRQRVSSSDLAADGIVHVVVPENPPAHEQPEAFCRRVSAAVVDGLRELLGAESSGDRVGDPGQAVVG